MSFSTTRGTALSSVVNWDSSTPNCREDCSGSNCVHRFGQTWPVRSGWKHLRETYTYFQTWTRSRLLKQRRAHLLATFSRHPQAAFPVTGVATHCDGKQSIVSGNRTKTRSDPSALQNARSTIYATKSAVRTTHIYRRTLCPSSKWEKNSTRSMWECCTEWTWKCDPCAPLPVKAQQRWRVSVVRA